MVACAWGEAKSGGVERAGLDAEVIDKTAAAQSGALRLPRARRIARTNWWLCPTYSNPGRPLNVLLPARSMAMLSWFCWADRCRLVSIPSPRVSHSDLAEDVSSEIDSACRRKTPSPDGRPAGNSLGFTPE